jgi:hypothetical protein
MRTKKKQLTQYLLFLLKKVNGRDLDSNELQKLPDRTLLI